jgi:uncharacterized protein YndB with AHSA1/START domain
MEMGVRIRAPWPRVYAAWADPDKVSQWFTDRAKGEVKPDATVTWVFEDLGYEIPYQVLEAAPGQRFALRGQVPGRPPLLLEVTLAQEGGETVLHLVNSGFLEGGGWDEEYEAVLSSWVMALELLKTYVEDHFGEARRTLLVLHKAAFHFEDVLPFFDSGAGLQTWLARSAELNGNSLRLTLWEGGTLTGRWLLASSRDAALTWSELPGILQLRAFSMGSAGRRLSVRVTTWGGAPSRLADLEAPFARALERLAARLPVPVAAL